MSRPFWSIVIPIHKPHDYLQQCLASVYSQYMDLSKEMEVLVQDNGDNYEWVKSSVRSNFLGQLDYQKNPANLGCYGSVNAAIRRATGRFIHVLHSDDFTEDYFYLTLYHCWLEFQSIQALSCHYSNLDQQCGWTSSPPRPRQDFGKITDWLRDVLTRGNPFQVCAVAIRRDVFDEIGYFREDMPYAADWEFYARLLTRYDWWYVPQDLARYRQHSAQDCHAMIRDGRAERDILKARALATEYRAQRELVRV